MLIFFKDNRKGQNSGTSAAVLVAIIAIMIILYTLFLPPEDRAKLLEENDDDNNKINDIDGKILLLKDPGRLDLIKKKEIEHKVSSFNLVSQTKGIILKEMDSISAKRTSFNEESMNMRFDIKDVENTDNILLSFTNMESAGKLIITLNDKVIVQKKINDINPAPIILPKENLFSSNSLKFSVTSPGLLFFKTNRYSLENIKIFADVTDISGLENEQSFFVTELEKENLEKVLVSFMTNCKSDKIGSLNLFLNSMQVYSGIPECEMPINLELAPNKLIEGENNVRFSADKGSYVIDQAKIKSKLKEEVFQTYFFEVTAEEMNHLKNNDIDINMSLIFVKSDDLQDVEVRINGRKFGIDNEERLYSELIDPYIKEGNNAISLKPLDSTVDIVELKIFIEDNNPDNDNRDNNRRRNFNRG